MKKKQATRGDWFRAVGAQVCLVTAILLYLPLFAAAWQARAMDCCDGTQCAAHGHASSKHGTKAGAAMECAHPGASALMDCKISCCEERERPMSAGMVFVLPVAIQQSEIMQAENFQLSLNVRVFPSIFDIPSPPPRS